MRLLATSLLITSTLLAACGGSSGGSDTRDLNRNSEQVQRESRTLDTPEPGYLATKDFYHFIDQNAVLALHFPNDSRDFRMLASVAIFEQDAASDSINRWIRNQTSSATDPRAAVPREVIELTSGEDFATQDSLPDGSEARSNGALYERYTLGYQLENVEHEAFDLRGFSSFTDVYLWVNDFNDIVNTALPIVETFSAPDSTAEFFSPDHKALRTRYARYAPSLVDELPAFYYPLCCFDGIGSNGRPVVDEERLSLTDTGLRLRDAQFTLGQTLHRYPEGNGDNPKIDSRLYHYDFAGITSWGELNLSESYRVSFCVRSASADGQLGLWVDNNAGEDIFNMPHSVTSRLINLDTGILIPGERVSVNVPGDVTIGSSPTTSIATHRGTAKSFLQVRVSGGGDVTLSDLVVERQSDNNTGDLTCEADG
ncbi:hypothetical protein [Marinimicrobium alkaliphilum]|uniref:hypothetical protein n=1 Tax=Marinimicrobium alkaliphilum TaxID=2202654 RepID=UPI000DBA9856|nr:hypothetical protein [Marinimicrobium alkaliphilum]